VNGTEWMQRHHRSILFLIAVLAIGGMVAAFKLPVALFPRVNFPRVVISLEAGDRPAERMTVEVTRPVEEAVRAVPGVREIRSTTTRGSADISINFDWGENMVAAMLQVESKINQVLASLPAGTTFSVKRMDPTVFPVLAYSLTSDTHSLVELREIALFQLRPLLTTVKGVARVGVQGGAAAEYQVVVDPARLDSLGLALEDVAQALSASNVLQAVGRLEDHYKLYLDISDTRLKNLDEIRNTIIRSGQNGLVRLDDIATVRMGVTPQWTRVTADGHDAVVLQVFQQPGGNTVRIAREVKQKLDGFRPHLPGGIRIANWYDQSTLILSSAASVRDAVLIGILFAVVILYLFLRNAKMTLVAAVMVPSILSATLLLLYVFHMRFNIMTLGGLAAAVGLIIDDMIVMEEQIVRRLRERGNNKSRNIMKAVEEITRPLAGSSASTTIIFAPLAFLGGVTGAFFKALSLSMASSLVVSFLVAWLGVPILAGHLLSGKDGEKEEGGRISRFCYAGYQKAMEPLLKRPILVLFGLLALIATGWFSYQRLGSGFMPHMDEGGFILDYRAPSGTSLSETDRLLRRVETILRTTPEVKTYSRRTGLQLGGSLTEANEGDFFVRLQPPPRRSIEAIMDDVRTRVEREVPGLEIEMAQLMEDLIGDLTSVPQPIEIKIFADDEHVLRRSGPRVAALIKTIPGVVDVKDGIVPAGDALMIHLDRDRAALEGVDPEAVTRMLSHYMSGVVTTEIRQGPKMMGVRVWIPGKLRATAKDMEALRIRSRDGHIFPLKRIAQVEVVTGQPQIMRDDLKRMIAVTGRISGRDMGSVIRDIKKTLSAAPGLFPKGVYYQLGGLYRQQRIAFSGLVNVFVSAVVLVFLLLVFLYESFRMAGAVMANTLLALSAVFFGLWVTGSKINISSMMGMIMIVGIVTETAIFYLSEYRSLPRGVPMEEALIQAGRNRMRPIAMTTVAAILALMPLGLGIGQGAAMLKPLAIAIISGLMIQMVLVLVILPVFVRILGCSEDPAR